MLRPCLPHALVSAVAFVAWGCGDGGKQQPDDEPRWQVIHEQLDTALLSVWGTGPEDVWAVGGDPGDGQGPLVLHYDGSEWQRLDTGQDGGMLWWVHGFANGPVFMGGAGGVLLRYDDGDFSLMDTPGEDTVFGIWGARPDDVWAVGGASESEGAFAWHYDGETWSADTALPDGVGDSAALWKVYGSASDDAWLVGSQGVSLHWDGEALSRGETGVGASLFTVHGAGDRFAAVGGLATGIIVEYDGQTWTDHTPELQPVGLSGVCLDGEGGGYAVGAFGGVYQRSSAGWRELDTDLSLNATLHAVWLDATGGVWSVGGHTYSEPLMDGVLVYGGPNPPNGGL